MKLKKIKIILVLIVLGMLAAAPLFSQYYPIYYGKSKVIKYKFNWQVIETANFNFHYYVSNPRLIKKIAVEAEKAYEKISRLLNMQVKKKIPLIFYKSHIDFEQTNLFPGFLPPGALAFAEPVGDRMVLQGDMSTEELSRVIIHELGHIFEYKVVGRGVRFSSPPGWVMEGFADYVTGYWRSFDLLMERDTVLSDRMPVITRAGNLQTQYRHARTEYNWGHLLYDFIAEKYGERGVRRLLYTYRGGALGSGGKNFLKSFDYSHKLFNYEFRKYVREKFKKFQTKENPEDYSFSIGPDLPFAYSFSHQLSPGGELLAVLTANMRGQKIDIILISMKDGKVIKNITPGFTTKYDDINLQFNPEDGISFSWDDKGERIAFFARKEFDYYFVILDVLSGKILKQVKIRNIEAPTSPDFHPNNKELYFTGIEHSKSYIYVIDLESDRIGRVTDGSLYIKALNLSPDGKKIVFSAEQGKYLKLFIGPIEKPELARQITDGEYNDITPVFSADSRFIYYSSDELESYNLNAIDLENKIMYRYTDVRTGNFFPIEIPGKKKQLVFSSYYKGMFHLFKKDISAPLEERGIRFGEIHKPQESPEEAGSAARPLQEGQPIFAAAEQIRPDTSSGPGFDIKEPVKYKPFKTLFITSLPPVTAGFGSDGSIFGYTSLGLSDLMGDHNFYFFAASFYGYRSYHLSYLNLRNRLQYYSTLFYYTDSYWLSYNAYMKIRQRLGGVLGIFYPFNRDYRAEFGFSLYHQKEFLSENLPYAQFFNGPASLVDLSLVGETTRFANYGPNMGHTFKFSVIRSIKAGPSFLDTYGVEADLRKYFRIDSNTLLAFRLSGYFSRGKNPQLYWIGGDNTLRAAEFRSLVGNSVFFFNAEFRFPIINFSSSVLGILGPIRGVFFFDLGGVWFGEDRFQFLEEGRFKLKDAISSYGFGLNLFLFGYPLHIDWVYQTDFYARKFYGVKFWIGFDF